ncbi:MAG TPA: helix-turn-helix transcriptional regulator [Gemmatimonadales bacterium]|nr:helix-turn-helix transcriptional regulator [Gemmatimonadales bacterium]
MAVPQPHAWGSSDQRKTLRRRNDRLAAELSEGVAALRRLLEQNAARAALPVREAGKDAGEAGARARTSGARPRPAEAALPGRFRLTARECQVALLLAEGRSNSDVAAALGVSPHTARHHTENVMAKLGARSRAEVGALIRGWLPPPRPPLG